MTAAVLLIGLGCHDEPDLPGNVMVEATLLTSDLVVGTELDAASEYQFVMVEDVLELDDGSFWIVDGFDQEASIRRYDSSGEFLGHVSRFGEGPGDFMRPRALASLLDGRVLLTDQLTPSRLTIFNSDGTLNEVVSAPDAYPVGASAGTVITESGVVWRMSTVSMRPTGAARPSFWSLMSLDGELLDTIYNPHLPTLNSERVAYESDDGRTTRGFALPYRPRAHSALMTSGHFLTVPEDAYKIYRIDGSEGGSGEPELFITRDPQRVTVSAEERVALRNETRAAIAEYAKPRSLNLDLAVPEVPTVKPILRGVTPMVGGGAMVGVSLPSVQSEEGWMDPNGFDVFDSDGEFRGRIVLPQGHVVIEANDAHLWTVFRDELDVQSIHRLRLPF